GFFRTLRGEGGGGGRTVQGGGGPFAGLGAVRMYVYGGVAPLSPRRWVHRIVAVSIDLEGHLARSFGAQRVQCIHNGIDLDQVLVTKPSNELRQELNLGARDFVIGTMGRLVPV